MRCLQCGTEMIEGREDFPYKGAGLPGVILLDMEVSRCPACEEWEVSIPCIEDLHRLLAEIVIRKPSRLTPEEIRFLRTFLGWSGADFARIFGVDRATVSRWETGAQDMGQTAEKLLRLSVAHGTPIAEYPVETLREVAREAPAPIHAKLRMAAGLWSELRAA